MVDPTQTTREDIDVGDMIIQADNWAAYGGPTGLFQFYKIKKINVKFYYP